MSWTECQECGRFLNSDDFDCFVYVGNYKRLHNTEVICEQCREELEMMDEEHRRQQEEGAP